MFVIVHLKGYEQLKFQDRDQNRTTEKNCKKILLGWWVNLLNPLPVNDANDLDQQATQPTRLRKTGSRSPTTKDRTVPIYLVICIQSILPDLKAARVAVSPVGAPAFLKHSHIAQQ